MQENEQIDKVFIELQDRMAERFMEFSNNESKLHPFYLFGIGKIDYSEAIEQIAFNFQREVDNNAL